MITRSQMPRQMYGLGSLVKKAVKGVKNVIKSPIGKAAILGAGIYGLGGGSFFGRMLPGVTKGNASGFGGFGFSNIIPNLKGLDTAGKIFTGGAGIKMLSGLFPQEEGEDDDTYADRISKLEPLLDRYYKNVNRNASPEEIKDFITANTQEYMAKGGRVGYRLGGDTMDREGIKSLEAGAPDVKYTGDMRLASESGPEEFELDLMSELMQAFEEAKRQGFKGDFKSFLDMYMGSQAQAPEGIMQEAPIQMAANGGRIGLENGSDGSSTGSFGANRYASELVESADSLLNKGDILMTDAEKLIASGKYPSEEELNEIQKRYDALVDKEETETNKFSKNLEDQKLGDALPYFLEKEKQINKRLEDSNTRADKIGLGSLDVSGITRSPSFREWYSLWEKGDPKANKHPQAKYFEDLIFNVDRKKYMKTKYDIEMAANGGRIGLETGGLGTLGGAMEEDEEDSYRAGVMSAMMGRKKVMGGGMMEMPTGIMRMNQGGVMERDYRDEGGFVPVGIKEKADDVPAMLSKNEFVMTADAVRAAGGGSVQKGAQKMYDTMKSLERKVV